MGIYVRRDSPYYWMLLEGSNIRRSTGVRWDGPSFIRKDNRRLAEDIYHHRMQELARSRLIGIEESKEHLIPPYVGPIPKAKDGWCYVYAIQAHDRIKIGRAVDVGKRIKTLQTGNGHGLTLLAAMPAHAVVEQLIHQRFQHLRITGEWYRPDPSLLAFLGMIRAGRNPIELLWDEKLPAGCQSQMIADNTPI